MSERACQGWRIRRSWRCWWRGSPVGSVVRAYLVVVPLLGSVIEEGAGAQWHGDSRNEVTAAWYLYFGSD